MTNVLPTTRKPAAVGLLLGVLLATNAGFSPPVVASEEPSAGAADEVNWSKEREFWSFRAPVASSVPRVQNQRWPRQRLDHFILARLEASQLSPTPEADRRTLIRRLTFDLTGLPPTPEAVAAFLSDQRTDAFERLVDRLLASPAFGERMASLWLPLARYAEDQAHQVGDDTKNFYPNAWRYRAWVINSFNRDLPYDDFLRLQLAADKLEGTNSPQLAALGFLGLGPKYYNRDRLDVQAEEWEDRVDTVSRAMLGLTVACARCHDHKFDPITTRDYYALAGVFASTRLVSRRADGVLEKSDTPSTNIAPATLHIVEDSDKVQDLAVFLRGNVDQKGPVVERRFLRVLSRDEPPPFKAGSGREELAAAIADRANPLTARVLVNRVWGMVFGMPLVATPSNFGHSGQPPTHPALLDDLAVRFMDEGWSVKTLVREMVLSATYRQASIGPAREGTEPPSSAHELFGRMNRRRLTVEQWRDAVLLASGELAPGGGPSLELDQATNLFRTVHARVSRLKLNDVLMQFDYPDANVHAEKRSVTTTAIQKLFVLNSPFMLARAKAFAARLNDDPTEKDAPRVARAYQILFGRAPSPEEAKLARAFLRKPAVSATTRWEQYAQLLLASNEMLYVD